ncbi:MAG TPA: glycosyltransferase family 1 protein, partial [Blastocatellia bacterium]|nr:glycosyltransferase family 1 protein [Blastocatellia bacterium]
TAAISGGRLYLEKLLPQFAELDSGHEFLVLQAGDLNSLAAAIDDPRVQFVRANIPFLKDGQWAGASILRMLWRKFVLPFHLRRLQPDLLFSNSGTVPLAKPAKTRTLIALHNCMPLNSKLIAEERSPVRRWRLRMLRRQMLHSLQACDGSIAFSEDTRRRIRENFGELPHLPAMVHHAIDWGEAERQSVISFDELQRQGIKRPYILCVSQFHRYKNVVRLVEAFARVAANHPQLQLALVGAAADGDYWNEVATAIETSQVAERIVHLPAVPREQLIALYRGALGFVQPSLAETCSFPLLEALALGVPAAAANSTAMPEMAGEAALYFDPLNVGEMSEIMERLVWDENLRGELSCKAIEQAAKFTWEQTARRTLAVFDQVV